VVEDADAGSTRRAVLCADRVAPGRPSSDGAEILSDHCNTIRTSVADHAGLIAKLTKGHVLAVFGDAVAAVRCGLEIQHRLELHNAALATEDRLFFRIGIGLGDVHDSAGRLLGDGVDVATRIEPLADPGGICVSGNAFDQVEDELPVHFQAIGLQAVKSLPNPVRVYRVAGAGSR